MHQFFEDITGYLGVLMNTSVMKSYLYYNESCFQGRNIANINLTKNVRNVFEISTRKYK